MIKKMGLILALTSIGGSGLNAQTLREEINALNDRLISLEYAMAQVRAQADSLKLLDIIARLDEIGYPDRSGEIIKHRAMALSYNEKHEQANWVAHIILRDVTEGRTSRTNDFRIDTMVATYSAIEEDYFLTSTLPDGKLEYEGFGFDRGHLAPSADFRWNQSALSESYFYSNMSPQRPELNRQDWANLESHIRDYAIEHQVDLYVVTGPVLTDDLPKIERSVNGLSIPEAYFKVVCDMESGSAIGFLMPNDKVDKPLEAYAKTVDEIELITGFNFFSNLSEAQADSLESKFDFRSWLPAYQQSDAPIMKPAEMGKGRYNSLQAYDHIGEKVEICGTIVDTFRSKKNNVFLNVDKKFPNTLFTFTIWSRNTANFSYEPEVELLNQRVCIKGEVKKQSKGIGIDLINEKQVVILSADESDF